MTEAMSEKKDVSAVQRGFNGSSAEVQNQKAESECKSGKGQLIKSIKGNLKEVIKEQAKVHHQNTYQQYQTAW